MDDKKIVIDGLTAKDYEILETRFSTMANEGLLIEDMKFRMSFYKRIQPKDIQFAVGIYPKSKTFETPDERVVASYVEAQKEKGWKHVFSRDHTHVFMNEDGKVIKDIDRTNQAENIKSILKPEIFGLFFAIAINFFGLWTSFRLDMYHFTSNFALVSLIVMPVIIVAAGFYLIYDIFRYIRISRMHSDDEVQIEDITGIVLLRKLWSVFIVAFSVILVVAIVADFLISGSRAILFLIPIIVVLFIAFKLRFFSPEHELGVVAKTIIALVALFFVTLIVAFMGVTSAEDGLGKELPGGYIALKLEDIGIEQDPGEVSFNTEGSILMPICYSYSEDSDPKRRNKISVHTQVCKVINKSLADYVFALEQENSTRYFGELSSAKEYYKDYDKAYFLDFGYDNSQEVKLQKGVFIFTFSGDLDLQDTSTINLINDTVDKIITSLE